MPPNPLTRDELVMALRSAVMWRGSAIEVMGDWLLVGSARIRLDGLQGRLNSDGFLVLSAGLQEHTQPDPQWAPMFMLNNALDAALALSQAKGEARSMPECAEEVRRAVGVLIRDNSLPVPAAPKASH